MSKAEESEGYEGEGGCGMGMGSRASLDLERRVVGGGKSLDCREPSKSLSFFLFRLALKIF